MLHPSDGVASPEFYFPLWEDFQEASDWPSRQKAASTEAAFLAEKSSRRRVTGKS